MTRKSRLIKRTNIINNSADLNEKIKDRKTCTVFLRSLLRIFDSVQMNSLIPLTVEQTNHFYDENALDSTRSTMKKTRENRTNFFFFFDY